MGTPANKIPNATAVRLYSLSSARWAANQVHHNPCETAAAAVVGGTSSLRLVGHLRSACGAQGINSAAARRRREAAPFPTSGE
jgi:hypothetical protein